MPKVSRLGHIGILYLSLRTGVLLSVILVASFLPHPGLNGQREPTPSDSIQQVHGGAVRFTDYPPKARALAFEKNLGQWDPRLNFVSRGDGYTAYLAARELLLTFGQGVSLQMSYVDANPQPIVTGVDRGFTKTHYLTGSNQTTWHTNVPNYEQVRYRELYPGVDLVYSGKGGFIQYDFVIEPRSTTDAIKLRFNNETALQVDTQGRLLVPTNSGRIIFNAPLAYQDSATQRTIIPSNYVLLGTSEIGFEVEQYDPNKELIIDPQLAYSSFLGGEGSESAADIALDGQRNVYVTGSTDSVDFPHVDAMDPTIGEHSGDAFVAKYDSAGAAVFRTYLGGTFLDSGQGIAVDAEGSIYVTGETSSSDFPLVNPLDTTQREFEVFVTKLASSGDQILFSTFLGGNGNDEGKAIAVGSDLTVYVTGSTSSLRFPESSALASFPLANAEQEIFLGHQAAFIARLDAISNQLMFSTYLSGTDSSYVRAHDIALDSYGVAYIVGTVASISDFQFYSVGTTPPSSGYNGGLHDAFLAKYAPDGSRVYSVYVGGAGTDRGYGVDVDRANDVYVTGSTDSQDFRVSLGSFDSSCGMDGACGQTTLPYGKQYPDAFVMKLNGLSAQVVYSTFLGGTGEEEGRDIAVDDAGQAYVTGISQAFPVSSADHDFPIANPLPDQPGYGGYGDAFVAKLNPEGSELRFSTFLGGSQSDEGNTIAIDNGRNVYVAEATHSLDFPIWSASQLTKGDPSIGKDAFISSILCADDIGGDSDSDGVCDDIEDDAPNNGDGNGDGTPDREQNQVTSLPNAVDSQFVTLVSSEGVLSEVKAFRPMTSPAGATFPVGTFHFTVKGLAKGGGTKVTLTLPASASVNSYYKYGPTANNSSANWYGFGFNGTVGAELSGNSVTLSLVDGQIGDHDLVPNGKIVEPGGPVLIGASGPAPTPTQGPPKLTLTATSTPISPTPKPFPSPLPTLGQTPERAVTTRTATRPPTPLPEPTETTTPAETVVEARTSAPEPTVAEPPSEKQALEEEDRQGLGRFCSLPTANGGSTDLGLLGLLAGIVSVGLIRRIRLRGN